MTRINCGIEPCELVDKHLLAELRELKRIPNCVARGKYNLKGQPSKFTLGAGHVKFFYDKLLYLQKRYEDLYIEAKNRGFNVTYFGDAWNNVPIELMNDYSPNESDRTIVLNRIEERLKLMKIK